MFAALNAGTASDAVGVGAAVAGDRAKPLRPELPNAFERYTNGGGPLKEPTPPRSWFFWSPVTSQLNAEARRDLRRCRARCSSRGRTP